jgi:hypothetical protein
MGPKSKAMSGAANRMFGLARQQKGSFAKIGAVGRSSSSTLSPEQLARSGKMRSAMVAGGVAGMGAMRNRRGPGTSKSSGRPTGMYGY